MITRPSHYAGVGLAPIHFTAVILARSLRGRDAVSGRVSPPSHFTVIARPDRAIQ
jgi:hypothetical protein